MNILRTAFGIILILWMGSCKKEQAMPGVASLTVIHAVVGETILRPNFKGTDPSVISAFSGLLSYGFFNRDYRFAVIPGHCTMGLNRFATDIYPFLLNMELPKASIHTLFLTGTVDEPESFLVKDDIPYYAAGDSTMGIRFVNLSPGSSPVSVNIKNKASGSEVAQIAYRGVTDFHRYPVSSKLSDYVFEFRHADSGELISSYTTKGISNNGISTPNVWLYKSFTLALIGKLDGKGTDAPKVMQISHSNI